MIKLVRDRTEAAVHPNFKGQKRIDLNLELMSKKKAGELATSKEFKSGIWKEAKTQLLKESNGKCAYCETPTSLIAFGDVEHFRPKSVYWWMAYCLENYLPSCVRCNQEAKRDKFPLVDPAKLLRGINVSTLSDAQLRKRAPLLTPDPVHTTKGLSHTTFFRQLKGEGPYLVNPYTDDPEEYFIWKADTVKKEVKLAASKAKYQRYVEEAEACYGINRTELKDYRFKNYYHYCTLRIALEEDKNSSAVMQRIQQSLLLMSADQAPWAGMIRYFDKLPLDALPLD